MSKRYRLAKPAFRFDPRGIIALAVCLGSAVVMLSIIFTTDRADRNTWIMFGLAFAATISGGYIVRSLLVR